MTKGKLNSNRPIQPGSAYSRGLFSSHPLQSPIGFHEILRVNVPKKILFVSSRSDIAGGEKYLLDVTRHMDRGRYRPMVVLPGQGSLQPALEQLDVENIIVESDYGWLRQPLYWYRYLRDLDGRVKFIAELIRNENISLVHTNSNLRLEGVLAANLIGVPHVYMAHAAFQPGLSLYERFPLSSISFAQIMGDLSAKVIAVSHWLAATLAPPLNVDKVKVIHNGLDFNSFDDAIASTKGSIRNELGLPADTFVVTSVGRIDPEKGHDHLVKAAAQVCHRMQNAHFLLAGSDDDKAFSDQLRRDVKKLGLAERFHFLGFRSDVPRLLAESDVFVLTSRSEGLGFVVLEAMAAGRAVIATRCGGAEEPIIEGVTGKLVDVGDVAAIAEAILDLAGDRRRRTEMGAAARGHVRKNFCVRSSVNSLMEVYDEIFTTVPKRSHSLMAELYLRGLFEVGDLGLRVVALEERLRQVEHLAEAVRGNVLYKMARRVRHWSNSRASRSG